MSERIYAALADFFVGERPFTRTERIRMAFIGLLAGGIVLGVWAGPLPSVVWTLGALPALLIAWHD